MSGTLIIPMYIQSSRRISATISGLVLLSGSILVAVINPIAGKLLNRFGSHMLLLMPLIPYGVSELGKNEISHGTAIVSSVRQMVGALGLSILVAIVSAASFQGSVDVHGINVSFGVQSIFVLTGLIISIIFIKPER